MKKVFMLEELDCANCAMKMENAISKLAGVISVRVNFMSQKLTLEAPDDLFDEIYKQALKEMKKVEPDIKVISK